MAIAATPEELLMSAFDKVQQEAVRLEKRRKAQEDAQQRAAAASSLGAAAELHFNNASARYRVLSVSAQSVAEPKERQSEHGQWEMELATAQAELSPAEGTEERLKQARVALEKLTVTTEQRLITAEESVTELESLAASLEEDANAAPAGHKAPLRNAARSVRAYSTTLAREHDMLRTALKAAKREVQGAPGTARSAEPRDKVRGLKEEPASADARHEARHHVVSAADLEKVNAEREAAQRVLLAAPELELQAQRDLRMARAALAEAQVRYDTAMEALEGAEDHYIDRVDLTGPDAQGLIEARAILKQPLPAGCHVRWTVQAGTVTESAGGEVRIDTHAVPPGSYLIQAHLERTPTTKRDA